MYLLLINCVTSFLNAFDHYINNASSPREQGVESLIQVAYFLLIVFDK